VVHQLDHADADVLWLLRGGLWGWGGGGLAGARGWGRWGLGALGSWEFGRVGVGVVGGSGGFSVSGPQTALLARPVCPPLYPLPATGMAAG
jgi:hypothetical protein